MFARRMSPIDSAAPWLAGALNVTPVGAVDSLATVCSVPLTALLPVQFQC